MTVFLHRYLVGGIARICSDLIFRVKTQDLTFDGWIRRWRRLSVVPFLEELLQENISRCRSDVKRWLVQMLIVVVGRSLF